MRRDEGIEDRVVEEADAGLVIRQIVSRRLIVVIKDQSASACDNALGRLRDGHTLNLVEGAIKGLNCGEGANIPNAESARYISRDDLICAGHPLYANHTVVVAFEAENLFLHVWVPNENVVIEARRKDQVVICVPIEGKYSHRVSKKWSLWLQVVHAPEANFFV